MLNKNIPTIFGGMSSSDDLVPFIVTPQACTPGIPWFPFIPGFPDLPLGPAIPEKLQTKLTSNRHRQHILCRLSFQINAILLNNEVFFRIENIKSN